jgi:hypothetical protein
MGELIPHTVDLTQTIKDLRSIDSVINDSVQILLDDKNDKGIERLVVNKLIRKFSQPF